MDRKVGIIESLRALGDLARYQGDYEGAKTFLLESLTLARQLGFKMNIADSLQDRYWAK